MRTVYTGEPLSRCWADNHSLSYLNCNRDWGVYEWCCFAAEGRKQSGSFGLFEYWSWYS